LAVMVFVEHGIVIETQLSGDLRALALRVKMCQPYKGPVCSDRTHHRIVLGIVPVGQCAGRDSDRDCEYAVFVSTRHSRY